ncbi:type II toxin-antitoxin system HicA family toxin [Zymomonas mobilis]|uniref:YcfA family protein n=2 Tax=Zymomonas mobilis TaxID=542 RepID=F8EWG5_ZYMMT|nr:type II toxin-antitoxin system HicA family toxin [Zymomonas mobilis]AEI38608.1 YcfA family protein [Zymomonas mobilis subsp. pomaceae ATCC 29192]MDX5949526.1 type II toxin-antitoxin system HicA family toxin [Zymomonas mobilis subsp. pomaceae]
MIKEVEKAGWILDRTRGSHHVFRHPHYSHHITIPHPKKELGVGLVRAIRKQAGL